MSLQRAAQGETQRRGGAGVHYMAPRHRPLLLLVCIVPNSSVSPLAPSTHHCQPAPCPPIPPTKGRLPVGFVQLNSRLGGEDLGR